LVVLALRITEPRSPNWLTPDSPQLSWPWRETERDFTGYFTGRPGKYAMTDPDAPPPIEPSQPDYDPGAVPDEEPMQQPPVKPGDDRPYDAASRPFPPLSSPD